RAFALCSRVTDPAEGAVRYPDARRAPSPDQPPAAIPGGRWSASAGGEQGGHLVVLDPAELPPRPAPVEDGHLELVGGDLPAVGGTERLDPQPDGRPELEALAVVGLEGVGDGLGLAAEDGEAVLVHHRAV